MAAALVLTLAGLVAGAVWQWSRSGRRLELRERALGAAEGRLDLLVSLPLHRRPKPGRYRAADAAQGDYADDLARVLEPRDLGGARLEFELVVEENPVEYPDYFFAGGGRVRHLDLRRYRILARGGDLEIELVTLR